MSQTRQLAAIMFTDIVGYTALMGNDEQKAFDLLKKNRGVASTNIITTDFSPLKKCKSSFENRRFGS